MMKLCIEWLREFVDIDISMEELARRLTDQGVAVEQFEKVGGDYVFELEITPNRPDQLSVFGIAREVKAMLGIPLKNNPFERTREETGNCPMIVEIEDGDDCPRYAGCLVENITIGPSPDWMQQRLERSGIRALNGIVDVTNYVLLETGHPLHAFDAACLEGGKIVIRRAQPTESLVTLDGTERKLDSDMLVIADSKKPVALAGIMGGEESEIKPHTKTIFIESAYFEPTRIRRSAKKLKLATESSYRFERSADIEAPIPALLRARDLMVELCKGTMKGGITDTYLRQSNGKKRVVFSVEWLNRFLGTDLSGKEITDSLNAIDLPAAGDTTIEVTIPSFRRDLVIKEDIAEETLRMVGFSKIPTNKAITLRRIASLPENDVKVRTIRNYFISCGFDEIVNISFVSHSEIEALRMGLDALPIRNPITSELTHLRPCLIAGLLKTVKRNLSVGIRDLHGFEIGSAFLKNHDGDSICEPLRIAGILVGNRKQRDWRGENRPYDYYDLKGIIEGLFENINIHQIAFTANEHQGLLHQGGTVRIGKDSIGFMGSVTREVADAFDISKKVLLFELELSSLLDRMSFDMDYTELPKYPAVLRDLCLVAPRNVTHDAIEEIIRENSNGLIRDIHLFDIYQGKDFDGRFKSLTYSLAFRSDTETLNDEVVNEAIARILHQLSERLGIKLRGKEQ
jgi:phenylalanyl-tRNA synthetase beta chain